MPRAASTSRRARRRRRRRLPRLDRFVRELLEKHGLPDASNAFVRKLIVAGAVRVNGHPIRRPAFALASRSQMEAFIDPARIDARRGAAAAPGRVAILYQDDDLIAVAKPAGLATHPGADPRRASLVTLVKAWLASKDPGTAPYLGVHQRLDRDTSGVRAFHALRASESCACRRRFTNAASRRCITRSARARATSGLTLASRCTSAALSRSKAPAARLG